MIRFDQKKKNVSKKPLLNLNNKSRCLKTKSTVVVDKENNKRETKRKDIKNSLTILFLSISFKESCIKFSFVIIISVHKNIIQKERNEILYH